MARSRNGGHPGAVPLDPRSLEAIKMLQRERTRDCDGCGVTHVAEELCIPCTQEAFTNAQRTGKVAVPVYHLAE